MALNKSFPFPEDRDEYCRRERRHLVPRSGWDAPVIQKPTSTWKTKKRLTPKEDRSERSLAMDFGIKRRVEDHRNGIPPRVPGDKPYRVPERSPGFHKRRHKTPPPDEEETKPMTYHEKKKRDEEAQNAREVLGLTASLEEPSWEEMTGYFLWKTKAQREGENPKNDDNEE